MCTVTLYTCNQLKQSIMNYTHMHVHTCALKSTRIRENDVTLYAPALASGSDRVH